MKFPWIAAILFLSTQAASAAECELTVTRKACPGLETEALKPYGGKNPTREKTTVETETACLKQAEKVSRIIRKDTLTEKKVSARFNGKELGRVFTDRDPCDN